MRHPEVPCDLLARGPHLNESRRNAMPSLSTQLNARSEEFRANAAAMRRLVDDLNAKLRDQAARQKEMEKEIESLRRK